MNALWDIVASGAHAIEQVIVHVESHHWIFGFLAGGTYFIFTTGACTLASMPWTNGSMK